MASGLYQDGYRVGRYKLDHIFNYTKPIDYMIGYKEGRRRRIMQLAIEFTLVGSILIAIMVLAVAAVTRSAFV